MPVALHDLDPPALVVERLTRLGDAAEPLEHEPGEGLVVALGHGEAAGVEHLVGVQGAVEQPLPGALHAGEPGRRPVVLVVDLADDLLEDVLERDDPGRAAVLVDHDREVAPDAPQVGEQVGEVAGLGHDEGRRHDRRDRAGAPLLVRARRTRP